MEDKFFDLHMKSAADKFRALLTHQPEVFQRVPLTYIASYLGISRETLSRLRSR
jgi:CRP-like cAMP-binding protein